MKHFFENIGIGLISNIVFAGLTFWGQNYFKWDFQIPLWLCFIIAAGIILIEKIVRYCIRACRIRNAISTYNYGYFGNSYLYKWEYVKNPNGLYGYEPINIQIAESKTLMDKPNTMVFRAGHYVEESKIRLIIRLSLIWMVERDSREKIQPILDYLHSTEKQ